MRGRSEEDGVVDVKGRDGDGDVSVGAAEGGFHERVDGVEVGVREGATRGRFEQVPERAEAEHDVVLAVWVGEAAGG